MVASAAAGADDRLAAARALLMSGKYAEAVDAYRPLAHDDASAAIGLARALESQGKPSDAVEALARGPAGDSAVEAELARLAFARGDYPVAATHADRALKLEARQTLARWIKAELDRVAGRHDAADRAYRALVRLYNDQDIDDADALRWIGLAAAQNARWNRVSDQFDFLVNEFYPDAIELDGAFWPVHYEAGRLFLEKYNRADAAKEFQKALALNPNAAEVHAAMAAMALEGRDVRQAQRALDRALEICPTLLPAWQLRADIQWMNFQPESALRTLEEHAKPLNPCDEETLGRMAACYLLLDGAAAAEPESRFSRLSADVASRNPQAGDFFFTLAQLLEARNKQAEAERHYRRAIELMPRHIGPPAALGLLLMRTGREDEARRMLNDASRVDPFHVRVDNMLQVLDVLDGMGAERTEQFVVRHDTERDAILARYALRHLERVHPRLCKLFGYTPPPPSLVQIFADAKGRSGHEWFSTRMTGLPYVGTVAASTGRIVAMVSPQEGRGTSYNWARVLTHEHVHVITLQQTDFNIPHWYTEGLAVWCEDAPRPREWTEVLASRLAAGTMFPLDELNFGFQRPQSGDDWTLAYCQAELYVELMLELGGEESLRQLLATYREGLDTPRAISRVFGMPQAEFERRYREYVDRVVASQLDRPSGRSFKTLLAAHRAAPDNDADAAELADAYVARGADREALALAEQVTARTKNHPLATSVLARLRLRAARKPDADRVVDKAVLAEAVEMLDAALDKTRPHATVLDLLASLKLQGDDYDGAAALYELGRRLEPDDVQWARSLARVYLLSKNEPKLYESLAALARVAPDDFTSRKNLVQLASSKGDFAAAASWANEAIEIDVRDAEVHRLLGEALSNLKKHDAAVEEFETAIALKADDYMAHFALADVLIQSKQPAKARQALKRLVAMQPDYPGAVELLESLEDESP
jgi:tetratricopeptide (TPR) repeat protein